MSLDNIIAENNLTDFPESYFKLASTEISDRLSIGTVICSFLDDVSDLEATFGKNITKIGTHGFSLGRSDCLPNFSTIWENIHKISTVHNGKQHISLSSSISQNLCKQFPEQSKSAKKKLVSISTKIFGLIDDLRKAKAAHKRNIEKYNKLVHDTESLIKASRFDSEQNELNDSTASSKANSELLNKEPTRDSTKIDKMNRSFSKMISKITSSEKSGISRYKEQIKEIDSSESQLIANSKRLSTCQDGIISEIRKAYIELEEIEMNRLNFLRDGLNNLYTYTVQLVDKKTSLLNPVSELLSSLDIKEELLNFLSQSNNVTQQTKKSILRFRMSSSSNDDNNSNISAPPNNGNIGDTTIATNDEMTVMPESDIVIDEKKYDKLLKLYDKIDRLMELMEYLKTLCSRMNLITSDIATTEASYYSSHSKMIEKHESLFEISTSPNNNSNNNSKDGVAKLESPSSLNGWVAIFKVIKDLGKTHSRNSKYYFDEICNRLNLVHRRVEIGKKDIQEKLSSRSKEIIGAENHLTQNNSKLTRLKTLLKERRQTLKQAIENIGNVDNNVIPEELSPHPNGSSSNDEIESENIVDDDRLNTSVSNDEVVAKKKKSMIQGLENFGSSLANVNFKVVVGLETSENRIQRIEKQIQSLEEEERELTETCQVANTNLLNITEINYNDLEIDLAATQNLVLSDLQLLKSVLDSMIRGHFDTLEDHRICNLDVKKNIEEINIPNDFLYLLRRIHKKANDSNNLDEASGLILLEIPSIDLFEPTKSVLIEEEKKNIIRSNTFESILDETIKVEPIPKLLNETTLHTISEGNEEEDSNKIQKIDNSSSIKVSESELKPVVVNKDKVNLDSNHQQQQTLPNSMSMAVESFKSFVNSTPSGKSSSVVTSAPIKEETELLKFGLSSNVKVYESYSCALYPKKGLLTHGRLYITQKYLAFSGWPDTRVLLAMRNVVNVERTNTLVYIPNALLIFTDNKQEYFFGSFIDRESCLQHINSLREVERKLFELHGAEAIPEYEATLEFGILSNNNNNSMKPMKPSKLVSNQLSSSNSSVASSVAKNEDEFSVVNSENSVGDQENGNSSSQNISRSLFTGDTASDESLVVDPTNKSSVISNPVKHATTLTNKVIASKHATTLTTTLAAVTKGHDVTVQKPIVAFPDKEEAVVDFPKLFSSSGLLHINEKVIDYNINDILNKCWLSGNGFNEFLKDCGETEIKNSDWKATVNNPIEDLTKIKFSFQRDYSFLHLRTSMLMFGPKLAPSTQVQYLFLSTVKSKDPEELKLVKPRQFMILLVTQLYGIPMSDVFKVLQYWSFDSIDPNKCRVTVGMGIHFLKSTLFKSQIINGTKDELIDQVKHWHTVTSNIMNKKTTVITSPGINEPSSNTNKNISNEVVEQTESVIKVPTKESIKEKITHIQQFNSFSNNIYTLTIIIFLLIIIYVQYSNNSKLWREIRDLQKQVEQNKLLFDYFTKENKELLNKIFSNLSNNNNDKFDV